MSRLGRRRCWRVTTTYEVEKLIFSTLCKTCQLDPAPTWLVQDMKAMLSLIVMLLCNKLLAVDHFPSDFKTAVV